MFLSNKYTKCYFSIIEKAKQRNMSNLSLERHHIIPKSLGGTDSLENISSLTPREHFICHWLLSKMTTGNHKRSMIFALNGMRRSNNFQNRYETKLTSRVYENNKKECYKYLSDIQKGISRGPMSEETKNKISKANSGKVRSPEYCELLSKRMTGSTRPRGAKSPRFGKPAWNRGLKMKPVNEVTRQKLSQALTGREFTEEHKANLRKPRGPRPTTTCPHCGKQGGEGIMARWHFSNCKFKSNTSIS